jgi:hypothetical protein
VQVSRTSERKGAQVHLYAAYLGGPLAEDRMGEDHEIVFVVAPDPAAAKESARHKWSGAGRGHVDAVREVAMVDGYEIELRRVGGGDRTTLDSYN